MGQVRLSLGFNIGENTGFYLIARYVSLCPFSARGRNDGERILGTGGRTREGERERERRRQLQVEGARRVYREKEKKERERRAGGIRERVHACVHASIGFRAFYDPPEYTTLAEKGALSPLADGSEKRTDA